MDYCRRLPHIYHIGCPIFVTWRLHDSLPPGRHFPGGKLTSGEAFVAVDRLLEETRTGPFYLRQPAIAGMIVEALLYNTEILKQYELHAYVVMPNHVHILITPHLPLPKIMKSLKGITAKRANIILNLTGIPFWQDESYDHEVLHQGEFDKIQEYIEENPVKAGLVFEPEDFPWSSGSGTRASRADRGSAPQGKT